MPKVIKPSARPPGIQAVDRAARILKTLAGGSRRLGVTELAVARRRYQWFGRRDVCMIPTPELRRRFL